MRRKYPGLKPAAEAMDFCMPTNAFKEAGGEKPAEHMMDVLVGIQKW